MAKFKDIREEEMVRDKLEAVTKTYSLDVMEIDIIKKLEDFLGAGWYIDVEDGKMKQVVIADDISTFWRYVRKRPGIECVKWHIFMFGKMGIFPQKCKSCWKVVVKPRTVKELFQLHEVMLHGTKLHCKCGVETRPFVGNPYGGYVYCQGEEEGRSAYEEMRGLVDKYISPDVEVVLKRYCSEFENQFGPTNLENPARDSEQALAISRLWENYLDKWVEIKDGYDQTPLTQKHVMHKWLLMAYHTFKDKTAKEFNITEESPDGSFYRKLVTYHEDKEEGQ